MPWVDIDYARSVVRQMYPNDRWCHRVRCMSDEQILAIYYKHEENRTAKRPIEKTDDTQKPTPCVKPKTIFTPYQGEQLAFTDILNQAEV